MIVEGHIGLFFIVVWPIAAAFISFLIGRYNKRMRDYFANFATFLVFGATIAIAFEANNENPPYFVLHGIMGYKIHLEMDGLRCIYAVITALMWMMTTLFSREYFAHYRNRNRYYFFTLLTLSGTMGVFLSADLVTTFLFFEIMSFTSYVMVIHDEKPKAIDASKTYIAVAVIGGLAMIFGIFMVNHLLGTTQISAFAEAMRSFDGDRTMLYVAAAFMLVGFGGKAGMYPIHIWLPNAHPAAPAPASALLSGVLTKTGIFGILVVSSLIFFQDYYWGMAMLILGVAGMFTGAMLALFSIDLKRTLACSSVSQIGFIMLGIGMQAISYSKYAPLAVQGTLLHMVNHSLIKLVLFMVAGVVYVNIHELDLNKVRGFGRGKPLFSFCFLMGALGIVGIPLWNGYISKKLLNKAITYYIEGFSDYSVMSTFFQSVETIFTFVGGLTTAYMIKIFVCVCLEKNRYNQDYMTKYNKKYLAPAGAVALTISALLLPVLGFNPDLFMIPIAKFGQSFMQGVDYYSTVSFYDGPTLLGALPSIGIGIVIYIFIVRGCLMSKDEEGRSIYINVWPSVLDIEKKIYKPLLLSILPFFGAMIARIYGSLIAGISSAGRRMFIRFRDFWIRETTQQHTNWNEIYSSGKGSYWDEMYAAVRDFVSEVLGLNFKKGFISVENLPKGLLTSRNTLNSLGYSLLLCFLGVVIVFIVVLFI